MTKTRNAQLQITRSRQTLATWGLMSPLSGRPTEVLRLLQMEIHALEALALEYPRNAPAAAQLIAAYGSLADRVQQALGVAARPWRKAA